MLPLGNMEYRVEKPSNTLRSWVSSYSSYREDLGRPVRRLTGEHVGEPRLLICLYDSPLLHVDLKFMSIADIEKRVDEPVGAYLRDWGVILFGISDARK